MLQGWLVTSISNPEDSRSLIKKSQNDFYPLVQNCTGFFAIKTETDRRIGLKDEGTYLSRIFHF